MKKERRKTQHFDRGDILGDSDCNTRRRFPMISASPPGSSGLSESKKEVQEVRDDGVGEEKRLTGDLKEGFRNGLRRRRIKEV